MFHDTQPARIGDDGSLDRWADFRVEHPREMLALLRELRDGNVPVNLSAPDGSALTTSLWALDATQQRLNFNADESNPQLQRLIDTDEVVAVAYLDSVKLQFDLQGLLLVRGERSCALQGAMPREIYRFQRRGAYRLRALERQTLIARLRHPSIPDMALELRLLDLSIGGCALFVPNDVPPLQPGSQLADVQIELDADTRFTTTLTLHHVSSIGRSDGVRLGCEWPKLSGTAERALQRYIDQTQKRRRLLSAG